MEKNNIEKLIDLVREKGDIDNIILEFLDHTFLNNSKNIIEALERGITKYVYSPSKKVLWTALGTEREYILYPQVFCSCVDFYKEVVINRNRKYCKHILAQVVSEALNIYKVIELEDREFRIRLEEMSKT